MKNFYRCILFLLLAAAIPANAQDQTLVLNNQNFIQEVAEPVVWIPNNTVVYEPTKLLLRSDYGKLFYIINNTLGNIEPAEYNDGIMLHGEVGRIVDYEVTALLERFDGRLEVFTRQYRVDRAENTSKTNRQPRFFDRELTYIHNDTDNGGTVNIKYMFDSTRYGVSIANRAVTFPIECTDNKEKLYSRQLEQLDGERPIYISLVKYDTLQLENAIIESFDAQVLRPAKPQFGSLRFGQTFRTNDVIQIKAQKPTDKIYYWQTDIGPNGYIFAPPKITQPDAWRQYTQPIVLNSAYENGTIGLAAFCLGENGLVSEIAGPYYLKVTDNEVDTKQLFAKIDHVYTNQCRLNGEELQYYSLVYDNAVLEFIDYSRHEQFYFKFKNDTTVGKSACIPCDGKFTFSNTGDNPVELDFFTREGKNFAKIVVLPSSMTFPYARDYKGTDILLSHASNVVFYLPQNDIKYEASLNDDRPLVVKKGSELFKGILATDNPSSGINTYRLRFAQFDNATGEIIRQSKVYTITVSPPRSNIFVASSGVDLNRYHNDTVQLSLNVANSKDKRDTIYYRIGLSDTWVEYYGPIEIIPPATGVYMVQIFAKVVDVYGNEYINEKPIEIHFDRRALFVDTQQPVSGNGTQLFPYNNLEAAIKTAYQKNIKIINIVSEEVKSFLPFDVYGDLIIQPNKADSTVNINLQCKSINRKSFNWFTVKPHALLEMRNINANVIGGNVFISSESGKVKLYGTNINLVPDSDFVIFDNKNSSIGISNLAVQGYGLTHGIVGLKADKAQIFMIDASYVLDGSKFKMFEISQCNTVTINGMAADLSCSREFVFAECANTKFNIDNIQLTLGGTFQTALGCKTTSADLTMNQCNFVFNAESAVSMGILDQTKSKAVITRSAFKLNNGLRIIGFAQNKSDVKFEQSLIDIQNGSEYGYNFRLKNCNLDLSSSVVRLYGCDSGVNFTLTNASLQSVNNSVFNYASPNSQIHYWLTDAKSLSSINSVYYCDDNGKDNAFIFNNSKKANNFVLLNNVVASCVALIQSPDSSLSDGDEESFTQTNICYEFNGDFNLDSENDYFIPNEDSILLQSGLDSAHSPLPVPEYDYMNNLRQNNRSGVDVGAVQKSGWF